MAVRDDIILHSLNNSNWLHQSKPTNLFRSESSHLLHCALLCTMLHQSQICVKLQHPSSCTYIHWTWIWEPSSQKDCGSKPISYSDRSSEYNVEYVARVSLIINCDTSTKAWLMFTNLIQLTRLPLGAATNVSTALILQYSLQES
jgi:hypothetical protein